MLTGLTESISVSCNMENPIEPEAERAGDDLLAVNGGRQAVENGGCEAVGSSADGETFGSKQ